MKTSLLKKSAVLCLLIGSASVFAADPSPAAPATQPATAPARGARGGGRGGAPATAADLAEMAKLKDLPAYASGLGDGDYSVGPAYAPAPETKAREGVPHGKVFQFTMDSAESKIYPGNAPFKRAVAVYVPAQYVAGTPFPCVVTCDQYGLRNQQLPNILDNMIADHRLPAMLAIMINPGGPERSMEYDTVSGKYTDFVETEVIPRAEKEANVKVTKDPEARMTLGGSSGGICAFTMAWFHPELYHRVVSYSGTFTNLQRSAEVPHGGWEYPENLIAKNPAKPLRVWIHVSENDNGAQSAASGFRNWVLANERLAADLKAKGYHYQFVYAKNAGHTEAKVISQTLPQAMEFVWKGYPIAGAK